MKKLDGKTAFVTGAGRGIGRAIALKLASDGANVVVNDLDAEPATEVVAEIEALGGRGLAFPGSVTQPDFGDAFIKAGVDAFGGVDIIVNNAGYTFDSLINKMSDHQFDAMMDVHLKAPFRILRAASHYIIPMAKEEAERGEEVVRKVVNISSIAGTGGNAGQVNYSSAKAGVLGMTKTLAKEWGRYKVNVNCVAFGLIKTRLTEAAAGGDASIDVEGRKIKVGVNPDLLKTMEATVPIGRAGTPAEAAGSVYLFCIPESNYVSGQVLVCGGGFSM